MTLQVKQYNSAGLYILESIQQETSMSPDSFGTLKSECMEHLFQRYRQYTLVHMSASSMSRMADNVCPFNVEPRSCTAEISAVPPARGG